MIDITYLFKVLLGSGLLILFYQLVLSRLKCFRFNRFYLLAILPVAFLIPFWHNPLTTQTPIPSLENVIAPVMLQDQEFPSPLTNTAVKNEKSTINQIKNILEKNKKTVLNKDSQTEYFPWMKVIGLIYVLVIIFFLIRFMVGLATLYKAVVGNERRSATPYTFVLLPKEDFIPYTFFRFIFLPKIKFEKDAIPDEIIQHEKAHARQLHSLDLMFLQLSIVFLWFNPFVFFLRKAVRANHEYLADQAVVQTKKETATYQLLLLENIQTSITPSFLTSSFNFLTIKKRFLMIQKKNNRILNILSQTLLIPVLALLVIILAKPTLIAQKVSTATNQIVTTDSVPDERNKGISAAEYQYYIAEMKKANFKFDSKNRNRNLVEELNNNPQGDSLRHLFKNMTWKQKAATWTQYQLFLIPKEKGDSLTTEDYNQYKEITAQITPKDQQISEEERVKNLDLLRKRYPRKDSNTVYFPNMVMLNDDNLYNKYAYITVMRQYMNRNQLHHLGYVTTVYPSLRKPKPVSPTSAQMDKWSKNPKLWGVWLNEKRIANSDLAQYKASDIYYFDASNLAANARKLDGFNVQLELYTKAGYDKTYKDWK